MRFTVYLPLDGRTQADVKVTEFTEAEKYSYKRHRTEIGRFTLVVPATANGIKRVCPDMLIYVEDDDTVCDSLIVSSVKNDGYHYTIEGTDLKGMLAYRYTLFPQEEIEAGTYGFDVQQGETSEIIKHYVNYNCVEPTDPNRTIVGLICDESGGGLAEDTYMSRLQPLNEVVEALCKNADIGYDIKMFLPGYENNYALEILPGEDRTNSTAGNRKCVFVDYLQNTETITKELDSSDRKTAVWTVNGNGVDDSVVMAIYKTDAAGFMRRETVLTANCDIDLTEMYVKANTTEMVDKETHSFVLADYTVYGKGFNVGDKVSVIKDGALIDQRILSANKEYSAESKKVIVEIGDIPEKKVIQKTSTSLGQRADDVKELALESAKLKKEIENNTGGVGEYMDKESDPHTPDDYVFNSSERFNDYRKFNLATKTGGNWSQLRYDHIEGYNNHVIFDESEHQANYRYTPEGFNHLEGYQNEIILPIDSNGYPPTVRAIHIEGYGNKYYPHGGSYYVHIEGEQNKISKSNRSHIGGGQITIDDAYSSIIRGDNIKCYKSFGDSIIVGRQITAYQASTSAIFGEYHEIEQNINQSHDGLMVAGHSHRIKPWANRCAVFGDGNTCTNSYTLVSGTGATTENISGNCYLAIGNNGNIMVLNGHGNLSITGQYSGAGADYAEYFEWLDGNPDGEDRCGMLVVLDGDKLIPAHGDEIFGIISAAPSVVGNAYELHWSGKYARDIFGRIITTPGGEPLISPDYDPNRNYIPRSKRPEWAAVGMTGRLVISGDGSCKAGGYVSARQGVGTSCYKNTGIRVLRRIDERHVEVIIK